MNWYFKIISNNKCKTQRLIILGCTRREIYFRFCIVLVATMVRWDDFPHRYKTYSDDSFDYTDDGECTSKRAEDSQDAMPEKVSYTHFDALVVFMSIISFITDTCMDAYVAYIHYTAGHMTYFILTIIFVVVPTMTMTIFSLRWYLIDAKDPNAPTSTSCQWALRAVCLLLQQSPVMRYVDSLVYGIRSKSKKYGKRIQRKYYQEMLFEDVDATLLRLFECFMEAAPQLLLQIYILADTLKDDFHYFHTVHCQVILVSTFASLISISWALSAYFRSLRFALPNKDNMSWSSTIVHALWRFFVIGARMLAIGLFASIFPHYLAIFCTAHWLVMTIWIISMKTKFCPNRCEEILYNGVIGVIFIFCYFNPIDTPTRYRYLFYYIVMITENTALMLIWYVHDGPAFQFSYTLLIVHYASFLTGLLFMMIYYLCLHPTQRIKLCLNWKDADTTPCTDNSDHFTKGVRLQSIKERI